MLRLRKVELHGFKSFCEKTHITFSGNGITCIVGPNGCGKSNIVDAISWVLGEQSHKLLRAERMSDCIFNGTAKRPPFGLSEVTLTLVDPELSEAAEKVLAMPEETSSGDPSAEVVDPAPQDDFAAEISTEAPPADEPASAKPHGKRGAHKPVHVPKPGEVVIGRRLYRSGQSEYIINGHVARLRDIQEIFMGMGLGPDSYAIIEQGRIGMILNSKPLDRRAIIEEAAGITMYKTKRRLAEAKLEASRLNLARVNDILVEVEKQLASLKRQASKARRYAELREQMRAALRAVLAGKAQSLDTEAERLERALREMAAAEADAARTLRELEAEQERLSARNYDLESELRQSQNLLSQTALDLDRAENRIIFNQEQARQLETRSERLLVEMDDAARETSGLENRLRDHAATVAALRQDASALESSLRDATESAGRDALERNNLESEIDRLRHDATRLAGESVRSHAEAVQAEETSARLAADEAQRAVALQAFQAECLTQSEKSRGAGDRYEKAARRSEELAAAVRDAQTRLADLRRSLQETNRQHDTTREALSAARARRASLEQILDERAYSADAVQKLFATNGQSARGFRAVGLLADYAEVEEKYETAVEQFLRDELEYVVVESFDHARAGVALLRDEVGGRATFFVDSLHKFRGMSSDTRSQEFGTLAAVPGVVARLDRLVEFRDPLGAAAKQYLSKLQSAYLVEDAARAERLAGEHSQLYFLTPDGTCYHGRMVSGGRAGEAGPLALKRELRRHETEAAGLEQEAATEQAEVARLEYEITAAEEWLAVTLAQHVDAEKEVVAAAHGREQSLTELRRLEEQRDAALGEIERLRAEATAARDRAAQAESRRAEAERSRAAAESEAVAAAGRLVQMRLAGEAQQEQVGRRREDLAAMTERLASAEITAERLAGESSEAHARAASLREQHTALVAERIGLESANAALAQQAENLRAEKFRIDDRQAALDREWNDARTRAAQLDDSLRGRRQSLDDQRAERNRSEIEKARNDSDRDYLRQTCVAELGAQPEELIGETASLLSGEELVTAEANYNEMRTRVESMGPVNMMALEEFQECEQRESFLRREHTDLIESIQNTQQAIAELDQVSRQKFEEAFTVINGNFAIAFQTLFGGGHGEMRLAEPDSSGEAGIDIVAQPPGKRLQNILLLSGGEKALTALALLIAVFRFQPSPFCILDEVDAPLDEANVGRFNKLLQEMGDQTQFIVVTHNRRTMEMGSVMYGVTMQEPGVSKLVSVRWEETAGAASEPGTRAASNAA